MSGKVVKLAVILGSVREGRFGPVVANWTVEQARQHGRFKVNLVDLAEVDLPLVLGPEPPAIATTDARPAEMAQLTAALDEADAFILVTPEYNRSFPASIKSLIDWHYTQWRAKPIGFVSYGSMSGGLRAVEQLRLVFAEMHAVTVRDCVSFANYWEQFQEDGTLGNPEPAQEAAKDLLNQLGWWAEALLDARANNPYQP
ncbi:NADPH-dependent oxidoreductase [Micromonospora sp. KC606]|uniref:NADPH-dependent FMN reductase n=1 Tax=Micromonospora sp. KC606 TaxID=2530379 RepID=UPI001044CA47|nr:NAD(P)H-dependent oxidoreductase [Micromonospora sp. KC606]TDC85974.1 NADPH-dependent oxidoreductase [Micromonospora sp. KC606]